MDSVEHDLGVL